MTSSLDHYETLGVASDADDREIKRAFYKLLKEYPPEQKPTEYKRIREAYDTLSDPASRKEYDGMAEFGDEIAALRDEAQGLMDGEDSDIEAAVRLLKKAVVLGPEIGYLRNQLGQCFLWLERPGDALKQFDKATAINPDSMAFRLNVGRAQEKLGLAEHAERTFRDVWAMDEEDYAAPRALASLLYQQDRKEEAHRVLDEAIGADGKVDFQDFFCLWDKLHFYLFGGDHDELPGMLETISHVAKSEADRKYAAFMLADAAQFLFKNKVFDKADLFLQSARMLAPEEEGVQAFADGASEVAEIDSALEAVLGNDAYHPLVQEFVRIRLAYYLDYMDEPTAEKQFDELFAVADDVMRTDPDAKKAKRSARKFKREHPAAADLVSNFLDAIEDAPAADQYRAECPYCSGMVVVEKWDTGTIGCPHCHNGFHFDGRVYSKGGAAGSSYSTSNTAAQADGCLVAVFISTFATLAAIGAAVSVIG